MASFNHKEIEPKWQKRWEEAEAFRVDDAGGDTDALYYLVMLPYPSGAGLHVGHVESYAAVDILARQKRMLGKKVLFPMGYDAFGLPAENYAIKMGVHPSETTNKAIETFRRQMKSVGLSFDWSREISTANPEYYKWSQWLFLKLYENDLAYRAKSPVNWCNSCNTVLANEQVVDNACERCATQVIQKELEQWFFRITKYADRLLEGLDRIDWPEKIKAMQRNWIGKSEGVQIEFYGKRDEKDFSIPVFTTRADTLFGVSYIVLAPEHPLVDSLTAPEYQQDVIRYRDAARKKSELERTGSDKAKTGTPIGAFAKHPLTGEEVPIWISDYVLMSYGTGAVMGVPAHDERDHGFASTYSLPIEQVIAPVAGEMPESGVYTDAGILLNSQEFDGLASDEAKQKITDTLEAKKLGARVTNYRIRDWLISRQRYWGAPIPIVWCEECGPQPEKEENLPVMLPMDVDFKPTGESPLVDSKSFHNVTCPSCGGEARRESDTMDTFMDSSWYYLRYCDPNNDQEFANKDIVDHWCPVDLYVGGAEHAVMHLLYARFFAYALKDLGYLSFEEPFLKLRNQGLILGPDGEKMSKSKGNVINPDEIVEQFGADTIRMYEMFMGPLEDAKPWSTEGAVGVRRFLDKVWKLREKLSDAPNEEVEKTLHKTIKKVTEDVEELKFNTAIAQMMTLANVMQSAETVPTESYKRFITLLAPFAPHLCEELWAELGGNASVFAESWPEYSESLTVDTLVEVAIQVNGKFRGTITIAPDLSEADARARAEAEENVQKYLEGKEVKKLIYVPGRMINFVV